MNYCTEIKNKLINNEICARVKDYSQKLTMELGKEYSKRYLWLMLRFYIVSQKVQTMSAQLTWSHYVEIISIKEIEKIVYYINVTQDLKLSVKTFAKE